MPVHPASVLAAWLLACSSTPSAPEASHLQVPLLPPPQPLGGSESLRVAPRAFVAGERFDEARPLTFELHIPAGATVTGRGLPPDVDDTGAELADLYVDADDQSVIQLELPVSQRALTDEQPSTAAHFDAPRFCRVGVPCDFSAGGAWRAIRVREAGGPTMVQELQLAHVGPSNLSFQEVPTWRVVGLWLDGAAVPLDEHDRIRFTYSGRTPLVANDWTDPAAPLHVRARYRADAAGLGCPAADRACWTEVASADTQGIRIEAGDPAFLRLHAPLDVEVGVPFEASGVVLDLTGNPTRVARDVELLVGGVAAGELAFAGDYRATVEVTAASAGPFVIDAQLGGIDVVPQRSMAWVAGERPWQRLAGDVHAHSGTGGNDTGFLRDLNPGDHRGSFPSARRSFDYQRLVVGYDFGGVSEHAMPGVDWDLPAIGFDAFRAGGLCEAAPERVEGIEGWWQASQQIAHEVDVEAGDAFVTFPAFEWHSQHESTGGEPKLHRVVVFRDHDTTGPYDWPLVPGHTPDLVPQCLVAYLAESGVPPADALVIPHLSSPSANNLDWDLTWRASSDAEALVSRAEMATYHPLVEIYSARAVRDDLVGQEQLALFEGNWTADPHAEPWTLRYGWRDTEAVIGVFGAADNHEAMPGVDNLYHSSTGEAADRQEPGGATFVLAAPGVDRRTAIWDALGARRTYATTGPRVWMDFTLTTPGGTVHTMGEELAAVDACALEGEIGVLAGQTIRRVELWQVRVGSSEDWTALLSSVPDKRTFTTAFGLANPWTADAEAGTRWLLYVRALLGPPVDDVLSPGEQRAAHRDAAWTSPMWIEWTDPGACP